MPKIQLKGFVDSVGQLVEVGANKTIKQTVIIKVPGWVNEFGEKKGNDELWSIDMLNDAIDKFNITEHHKNAKVSVEAYINSSFYENTTTGKSGCIINARMAKFEVLELASVKKASSDPLSATAGEDDDLPF